MLGLPQLPELIVTWLALSLLKVDHSICLIDETLQPKVLQNMGIVIRHLWSVLKSMFSSLLQPIDAFRIIRPIRITNSVFSFLYFVAPYRYWVICLKIQTAFYSFSLKLIKFKYILHKFSQTHLEWWTFY